MSSTSTTLALFPASTNVPAGTARSNPVRSTVIGPLAGGYGATVTAKITNGASPPAVGCTIELQISTDGVNWRYYDQMIGDIVASSGGTGTFQRLAPEIQYVSAIAYGNTNFAVTVDGEISKLTGL
jgi:hypothetical protein